MFTDTVKTSVSTFSANLNNKIQLVNIYTIKGNNVAECHVFELVEIWKLLYTLNISVKSKDVEKAYITATLTAEGDDEFIFKLNNSYNMSLPSNAGSCKTCSACGDYTNFYKNSTKTFDVTQYLQDTNSIYVYFHNFTGGYSYKISNLEFTIKTYSKLQFTDTIRANFDNFNSKLSISINVKNYDDINISKVENYYCNGNSLTFQPHIYNYKIAYWRVVKSIEIEISGQADDYAQVIVNNSITVHPNLQDTLGIKDGIYIWGKTQSSDYVKEKHPFTMTNENLNIQFGTVNTLPTACYLKASLKIRLFFQFTDTLNPISIEISTLNKQLSNTVTYIFFNGEVKAQINYSSVIGCMRGVCLSEMNSSLSMWTTLSEFSVRVLSAGGNHSENIIVSSHTASYYGDYAVVYTKTGKIVKKGSYSVSCIVPAGHMGTPAYGQSGVFTIP